MQAVSEQTLGQRIAHSRTWQTLRAATWLEWQARGNWTNPALYLLYLIARPVTAALVLVLMYKVVSGPSATGGLLGYLVVGSATWTFVEQIMAGLPQAVLADREEYAMLKYVYIAPSRFMVFLIGRSIPRMGVAFLSFVITVGFGIAALGVPIKLLHVDYVLLLLSLLVGFIAIVGLGIALAGFALVLKRGAYQMPQAVTGALYLVSGAIFPIVILPGWLNALSLATPLTYWLELVRRALLGTANDPRFPIASTPAIFGWLALTTALYAVAGLITFRICEHYARERGQIDRTTGN